MFRNLRLWERKITLLLSYVTNIVFYSFNINSYSNAWEGMVCNRDAHEVWWGSEDKILGDR